MGVLWVLNCSPGTSLLPIGCHLPKASSTVCRCSFKLLAVLLIRNIDNPLLWPHAIMFISLHAVLFTLAMSCRLLILLRMPLTVFWKRNVYSDRVTLVLSIHAPFIVIWHAFCATPLFCLAILEQLLAGVPSLIHSTCLSWDIRKYADAL